jgi:peroxiredoxin
MAAKTHSDTLRAGDHAPEFCLTAANLPGEFALSALRGRGPVILEFLRGTW